MLINENLKKIFGAKYYQNVLKYIEVIQNALNSYDVVVFMARKAYCFFQSLKANNLLTIPDTCVVLSSRAVTFNGFDYSNKKIAIVEDVVILGESLFEIVEEDRFKTANLDIFMFACSQNFSLKISNDRSKDFFNTSLILTESELLELATLITNYIVYEMMPYNADYPSFSFEFSNREELDQLFQHYNFCSITELVHCKNKFISEGVLPIEDYLFKDILSQKLIKDSIFKIRVYVDEYKKKCCLVPIVIFTKIRALELENIFEQMFANKFDSLAEYGNKQKTLINKERIICYILAEKMLFSYLPNFIDKYDIKKTSSEKEIFSFEFSNDYVSCVAFNSNILKLYSQKALKKSVLYNSLGYAYDLLINNLNVVSAESLEFNNEFISFDDIIEKVSIVSYDYSTLKLIGSLILDVFIDNGVIVPRTSLDNDSILRIYKFGEVAKLTSRDIKLFVLFLGEYSDIIKRMLEKTEIEKISVIFFRNFNNNFDVENNEAEAYRICYSKFGPRISSSKTLYKVSQGQALIDVFASENLVKQIGDKYNIETVYQEENDNKVKTLQRTILASKLKKLNDYFITAQNSNPDNEIFVYINSYVRLLTLLSIGSAEQDKLLSLIAEVDLIINKNFSNQKELSQIIKLFNSIIDGILSGVWKYFCYKKNNLINNALKLMCNASKEDNAILAIDIFWQPEKSENQYITDEFFDEIGNFLIDVVAFYYYLCKYNKSKIHDDYNRLPYKDIFKMEPMISAFKKYENLFSQNCDFIEKFVLEYILEIDNKSNLILDEFKIFDETSSLNYETYSKCIAIFNMSKGDVDNSKYKDMRTYKYNDTLIIPIHNRNKKIVLDHICGLLDNVDIKALYYASNNDNVLLHSSNSSFYGKKFLSEIDNVVDFVRQNFQSTVSKELIILPRKEFNGRELQTEEYLFEFVNKTTINNGRVIYEYYFKENKKMKVENIFIFGNYYNIEKLSGDFNIVQERCNDSNVKQYIQDAKDAIEKKDESKLKKCLKWLGENAIDLIKDVGAGVLANVISNSVL